MGYLFKAKADALKSLKDKIVSGFDAVKGSILAWKGDLLRSKGYELISKGQSLLDFGSGLKKPKGNKGGYPAPGELLPCLLSRCGPFVELSFILEPFQSLILRKSILSLPSPRVRTTTSQLRPSPSHLPRPQGSQGSQGYQGS